MNVSLLTNNIKLTSSNYERNKSFFCFNFFLGGGRKPGVKQREATIKLKYYTSANKTSKVIIAK